ncbi:MAG: type I DNA topoisomerase [Candidatus Aminicenantes bacterium]|nr:type I DNA topoisomerase [Candidatus Aminicenantes bacterium]
MAKKTLIIVESPAKSHTISRYLGDDFVIGSSMGHVRDLPAAVLGIDLKNNYRPFYEELPAKAAVIKELRRLARAAEQVLLASDPDREGEAIAFHLQQILRGDNPRIQRVLFNEITRASVLEAVRRPRAIDGHKVDSQQMRRLLDRLAGYKISPVLQRKIGGPLSAGRVQSIALKLIVEREKEIRAFVSEEYWTISVELLGSRKPSFAAKLEKHKGKAVHIPDKESCAAVLAELKPEGYILDRVQRKSRKRKAPPPLITSTLQQEAFRRFRFPVKKTMQLAQQLYEGLSLRGGETTGLITYMRTDSFRVSEQARDQARAHIAAAWGQEYCPAAPNVYKRKSKIQDAHECIRPTFPFHAPEDIKAELTPGQLKIYQLVWERFFASQMADAAIEETRFDVKNGAYLFLSKGEVVTFKGFLAVQKGDGEQEVLPRLQEKENLRLLKIDDKQNFTKPPARYSEATLVKVLEEKGIGRPSTYAKIIETLNKREYVTSEEKKFVPSDLGVKVVDYLEANFSDIMNFNFTAELEKELDQVAAGQLDWVTGIDRFYQKLAVDLEKVKDGGKVELRTGGRCPECGGDLVKKYSLRTRGWFVGCANYPRCRYTERLASNNGKAEKDEVIEKSCPKCGKPLVKRFSPKTRRHFIGCTGYPACRHIESENEELGACPQCGKPLAKRFSRKTRRYFIGCTGYPDCNFVQKG